MKQIKDFILSLYYHKNNFKKGLATIEARHQYQFLKATQTHLKNRTE
ncbi:hypothetical protein J2W95_001466 [Flavobacterium granuli]|uniref:Uncharacterized protein n=1 Tax=Flavobacterium granuli TaxID=280093 RepID=A0ABU1S1G0_9FLAO|nr:hypothetical protein [Flavobacterium granuli]